MCSKKYPLVYPRHQIRRQSTELSHLSLPPVMPRPQFSIRTLLWLALVVAAFLGGIGFEKIILRRELQRSMPEVSRVPEFNLALKAPAAQRNWSLFLTNGNRASSRLHAFRSRRPKSGKWYHYPPADSLAISRLVRLFWRVWPNRRNQQSRNPRDRDGRRNAAPKKRVGARRKPLKQRKTVKDHLYPVNLFVSAEDQRKLDAIDEEFCCDSLSRAARISLKRWHA